MPILGGLLRDALEPVERESRFKESTGVVEDISSLLQVLREELGSPEFWVFRGQAEWDWSLRPKRGRLSQAGEVFSMELGEEDPELPLRPGLAANLAALEDYQEFEDWRAEAIGLVPPSLPRPASSLEWLAIGQHHGLPTRLLDWSRNPLVGTYFAVREDPSYSAGCDSALFALRGLLELPAALVPQLDPWEVQGVRLWHPPSLVERIGRQSGLFTLHQVGDKGGSLDLVTYAEGLWYDDAGFITEKLWSIVDLELVKIRVAGPARASLLHELGLLGVDEFFAFPDLQGLCAAYRSGRFRTPRLSHIFRDLRPQPK